MLRAWGKKINFFFTMSDLSGKLEIAEKFGCMCVRRVEKLPVLVPSGII